MKVIKFASAILGITALIAALTGATHQFFIAFVCYMLYTSIELEEDSHKEVEEETDGE